MATPGDININFSPSLEQTSADFGKWLTSIQNKVRGTNLSLGIDLPGQQDIEKTSKGIDALRSKFEIATRSAKGITDQSSRLEKALGVLTGRAQRAEAEISKLGKATQWADGKSRQLSGGIEKAYHSSDSLIESMIKAIPVVGPLGAAFLSIGVDLEKMGKQALRTTSQIALEFGRELPASVTTGGTALTKDINELARTMTGLGKTYGLSNEEIIRGMQGLGAAFPTDQLEKGVGTLGTMQSRFKGFEEAVIMAHHSGLDLSETIDLLSTSYLELGATGLDKAQEGFARVMAYSNATGLAQSKMIPMVMDLARSYAMFGMRAEGAAGAVANVALSLGEGRMGLAGRLAGALTGGMLQMGRGAQALIGMRGGIQGAPLQTALRFQTQVETAPVEAMRTLQKAMTGIFGRITTMEEGARTPEGARQFIVQQEMLQQITGLGRAEARQTLELLTKLGDKAVDQTKIADDAKKITEGMKSDAEKQTDYMRETMSFYTKIEKDIKDTTARVTDIAGGLSSTQKAIEDWATGKGSFKDVVKELKGVTGLTKIIEKMDTMIGFLESIAGIKAPLIGKGTAEEMRAEAEKHLGLIPEVRRGKTRWARPGTQPVQIGTGIEERGPVSYNVGG